MSIIQRGGRRGRGGFAGEDNWRAQDDCDVSVSAGFWMRRFIEKLLKQRLPQLASPTHELVVASVCNPFAEPSYEEIWYAAAVGNKVRIGKARISSRGFWFPKAVVDETAEETITVEPSATVCGALGIAGPIPRHTEWKQTNGSFDSGDPWLLTQIDGARMTYDLDFIDGDDAAHVFCQSFTRKLDNLLSVKV